MPLINLDMHSGVPIYRQVLDQLRHQILAGQLARDEQIPSVRDLAAQLRVNPMTISKAYFLLEQEGFVDRHRGVGLFVRALTADRRRQAGTQAAEDALRAAAAKAVQLGLARGEAMAVFAAEYDRLKSAPRGEA